MYKLCGGTLFVLLLHSAKKFYPRKSEYYYLSDALKILYPELQFTRNSCTKSTVDVAVNRFKKCNKNEISSFASVFCDDSLKNTLTANIKGNYGKLLNRSEEYVKKFIEIESAKDVLFVKAVIEVILNDEDISEETTFHISPDGQSVSKKELRSMNQFYLPSFLLGVLYYVMMNISDNWKGEDTYNKWCPPVPGKKERPYKANIGENSSRNIELLPKPITEKKLKNRPFSMIHPINKVLKFNPNALKTIVYIPYDERERLKSAYRTITNSLVNLIELSEKVREEYFATYGNDYNAQLIDSYFKNNSALKEQYCLPHQELKSLYEKSLRSFGYISSSDDNLKQFFNITGKIIEYISIGNILSEQFSLNEFVELISEFYDYCQRLR
ncbi:MAG: hypothetical protein WBK46_01540 [Ruminococcus flavefaciens]